MSQDTRTPGLTRAAAARLISDVYRQSHGEPLKAPPSWAVTAVLNAYRLGLNAGKLMDKEKRDA